MPLYNNATISTDAALFTGANATASSAGGRRAVRLENGWHVVVLSKTDYHEFFVYKPEQTNASWQPLCHMYYSSINETGISMEAIGNYVYFVSSDTNNLESYGFDATTVPNQNLYNTPPYFIDNITTNEIAVESVSLIRNITGTELHVAWSGKNSSYNATVNVRYAKGTVTAPGSVTWGAAVQKTKEIGSSTRYNFPSIILTQEGNPLIFAQYSNNNANAGIFVLGAGTMTHSTVDGPYQFLPSGPISTYVHQAPSALLVPKFINGKDKGRIYLVWHGTSQFNTREDIYYAYSDDSGLNWSNYSQITTGYNVYPSITANKDGKVFVTFQREFEEIHYVEWEEVNWSSEKSLYVGENGFAPSAVFDPTFTFEFDIPLAIYTTDTKVGISGGAPIVSINVGEGSIGAKTEANKSSFLTYAITSDSAMSTVTEKLNGTVINTRTLTSGQSATIGLTQGQWDSLRFGKYRDAAGSRNEVEVSMGNEAWTFTFNKKPAYDADMFTAIEAIRDSEETHLPSVKKELADAISSKSVPAASTDSFDTLVTKIESIHSVEFASNVEQEVYTDNPIPKGVRVHGVMKAPVLLPSTPTVAGGIYGMCFSNAGDLLLVRDDLYRVNRDGAVPTLTFVENLNVAGVYTPAFSPDDQYLAISHTLFPYISIFKKSGGSYVKLPNPDTLPLDRSYGCAFSPSGSHLAVVVNMSGSNGIVYYVRSGDSFLKVSGPDVYPTQGPYAPSFSPDGKYFVVGNTLDPRVTIYKTSGNSLIKQPTPAQTPASGVYYKTAWSPDSKFLALPTISSPGIYIYRVEGDTFTYTGIPDNYAATGAKSVDFSPNGKYLALASGNNPYLALHRKNELGDKFTRLTTVPTGAGSDPVVAAYSPQGDLIALGGGASPYLTVFHTRAEVIQTNALGVMPQDAEWFGVTKEEAKAGQKSKITKAWGR